MRMSERLARIIQKSVEYSINNGYELVTPETFLLNLCYEPEFRAAFGSCGGSVDVLVGVLQEYID